MKKEELFKNLFDAVVEMNEQKGKDAASYLLRKIIILWRVSRTVCQRGWKL